MTSVEARNHFLMPWANNSKNAIMFQKGGAGLRSAQATWKRGCGVSILLKLFQNIFVTCLPISKRIKVCTSHSTEGLWSFYLIGVLSKNILTSLPISKRGRGAGLRSAQAILKRGCGVSTLFEFFQNILCLLYNSFYSSKIQKVRIYYKCCLDRIVDVGDYIHEFMTAIKLMF